MIRKNRNDYYFNLAKKEGYLARSAYKLKTADLKYNLIRKGDAVLDLGCYPGSWLQYCAERVGKKGVLVGVDRKEPESLPGEVTFIQGDVHVMDLETIRQAFPEFDLVLSDLAPDTTGDRFVDGVRSYELANRALDIADALLKPGGRFFCKIFQSGEFDVFLTDVRRAYETTRVFKPPSSRKASRETFVVGINKRI
ncbi:MAG: RlmE family RNA methyltransferase [Deltaproteobacteria bacterium]|nr:RlmE family RNA methyltransferase [Deltaproteobacteria bacterium]